MAKTTAKQKVFLVGKLNRAEIKEGTDRHGNDYKSYKYGIQLKKGGYITLNKFRNLNKDESPKFAQWMEEVEMELKSFEKRLAKDEDIYMQSYIAPNKGVQYSTIEHHVGDDGTKYLQGNSVPKEIDETEYEQKACGYTLDMYVADKAPFDGELKVTTGGDFESILYLNVPDDKVGVLEKLKIGKGYRFKVKYEKGEMIEDNASTEEADTMDEFFVDEEIDQQDSGGSANFAPDRLLVTKIKPIKDMVLEGAEVEEEETLI